MDLNSLIKSQWDRVGAIALTVIGALFLLVGWIGVSGSAYLAEQAPYIVSGGIGGVFFLGIGATLWISADLRDEWRKLDRIEAALGDGTLRWADDSDLDQGPVAGRPAEDLLYSDETPVRASANGAAPSRTAAVAATATATRRTSSTPRTASTRTSSSRPRTTRTSGAES